MDLCYGGTLLDFIEDTGPLPDCLAASHLHIIATAAHACHQQGTSLDTILTLTPHSKPFGLGHTESPVFAGYVHNDIKPENILLVHDKPESTIKLSDFGLARPIADFADPQNWRRYGTLGYMAPEVRTRGQVSTKSDMFSIGVVLYYMVVGKLPFEFRISKSCCCCCCCCNLRLLLLLPLPVWVLLCKLPGYLSSCNRKFVESAAQPTSSWGIEIRIQSCIW